MRDKKLLSQLANNAKTPIIDLASELHITPKTVINKIRTFEKEKIIVGYRTNFNLKKLGLSSFKVIFNLQNINQKELKTFKTYLKQSPHIIYDNETIGGYDIEIDIEVKNFEELRKFIEDVKIKYGKHIKNYFYLSLNEIYKHIFFPE